MELGPGMASILCPPVIEKASSYLERGPGDR